MMRDGQYAKRRKEGGHSKRYRDERMHGRRRDEYDDRQNRDGYRGRRDYDEDAPERKMDTRDEDMPKKRRQSTRALVAEIQERVAQIKQHPDLRDAEKEMPLGFVIACLDQTWQDAGELNHLDIDESTWMAAHPRKYPAEDVAAPHAVAPATK